MYNGVHNNKNRSFLEKQWRMKLRSMCSPKDVFSLNLNLESLNSGEKHSSSALKKILLGKK